MAITSILPNQYKRNNREYILPLPLGLPISMMFNIDPIDYADFNNLQLAGVDGAGNIVYPDMVPLQRVFEPDNPTFYKLYFENLILLEGKLYNDIYFIVFDEITQDVIFKSNCFRTRPTEDADSLARLSYRNSTNLLGFNFEGLPSFRQTLYVDLNAIEFAPDYDTDNYIEVTSGFVRPKESEHRLRVVL